MRLILTSAGFSNKIIADTLRKLVKEIKIAFIPTAANVEKGDKAWLINDYLNCKKLGSVDIVDISALNKSVWLPRLKEANVIVVGGGDTKYLMDCINFSGLKKELPGLLRKRIYVGISAGSCVLSETLNTSSEYLYGDESKKSIKGLGYINFNVRPHLNSKYFPLVRDHVLKKYIKKIRGDTYAIDDKSAVVVDGKKIRVISSGKYIIYKKQNPKKKK